MCRYLCDLRLMSFVDHYAMLCAMDFYRIYTRIITHMNNNSAILNNIKKEFSKKIIRKSTNLRLIYA